MSINILVVDDEKEIADLVELYLKNENYIIYKYYSAKEALNCIKNTDLDLAIIDVMMPDINGFELCQQIRERHNFPVIMLTAKVEDIDKITGLTLGADDYITKPFNPLEVVARVKAQLRRFTRYNEGSQAQKYIIDYAGLVMNKNTYKCSLNEKELSLTPTEFSILWILSENRGNVVSSEDLFEKVWGEKYFSNNNNTVMVHIRHLREKMNDTTSDHKFIKTVWGVGYKIEKWYFET